MSRTPSSSSAKTDDAEQPLVPRMRFPEFRNGPRWREPPLREVCEINPSADELPESFIYIDLDSVDGGVLTARKRMARQDAPSRAQRLLERHDTIFQIVRPYQRNNLFVDFDDGDTYVASTGYAQLRAHASKRFLYQAVHTDIFVDRVIANCTGSSYPAINSSDLGEISLPVPSSPDEQQKIADCLTSLDEVIAAQARKVEALKAHKKGLMQHLFPQEGQTLPRLRFPEFRDEPAWESTDFEEVVFFQEGPGIMAADFRDDGVPLVRLSGLNGPTLTLVGCNYLDATKVRSKWNHFRLAVNDLVVSCSATFGRPARVNDDAAGAVFYTGLVRFRPKDARLELEFLETFLSSPNFLRQAGFHAVGGGIKHFGPTHLKQMTILFPTVPAEQLRIARCLSSLDATIAAAAAALAALRTCKKGLMQALFP